MARGGYRPVWACSRAGPISFRRWRRAPYSCHEGSSSVPGRTRVACGWLPAVARGDGLQILNQVSLEESGAGSGCTLWRSVLSDRSPIIARILWEGVLMHLMALGAWCFLTCPVHEAGH